MLPQRRSRMFMRRTAYLSIVVLSGCLIAVLLLSLYAQSLSEAQRRNAQTGTESVAMDLSLQLSVMEATRVDILNRYFYQPEVFLGSKYRELELVEDLARVSPYSPVISTHFLYYQNLNRLFLPGNTSGLENYFRRTLQSEPTEAFYESLRSAREFQVLRLDEERIIFLWPLSFSGNTNEKGHAVCGFVVTESALLERGRLIGGFEEGISIYWGDECLAGGTDVSHEQLYADTLEGELRVQMDTEKIRGVRLGDDGTLMLRTVISIAIALSLAGALILWRVNRDEKPMQALLEKVMERDLMPPGMERNGSDIERLGAALETALDLSRVNKERISENIKLIEQQRTELHQQILLMLIGGRDGELTPDALSALHFGADGALYAVVLMTASPGGELSRQLPGEIEALTERTLRFHTLWLNPGKRLVVFLSFMDESQCAEQLELLRALLDETNPSCRMQKGCIVSRPKALRESFLSALTDEKPGAVTIEAYSMGGELFYDNSRILSMSRNLGSMDLDAAQEDARQFAAYLDRFSIYMKRLVLADAVSSVVRYLNTIGVYGIEEAAGGLLALHPSDDCADLLAGFCSSVISRMHSEEKSRYERDTRRIIHEIEEHLLDYDLSLEMIADSCSMSAQAVSRLILERTGKHYRDYVIARRVERARRFLTEDNLSVAATSERLGYSNVSSFIRVFKAAAGVTPAKYKEAYLAGALAEAEDSRTGVLDV